MIDWNSGALRCGNERNEASISARRERDERASVCYCVIQARGTLIETMYN